MSTSPWETNIVDQHIPTVPGISDGISNPNVDSVEIQCRICSLVDPPLYRPCKCAGSIAHVHQECLDNWLKRSKNPFTGSERSTCEVCGYKYIRSPVYSDAMPSRIPWWQIAINRKAWGHIGVLLLLTLFAAFKYIWIGHILVYTLPLDVAHVMANNLLTSHVLPEVVLPPILLLLHNITVYLYSFFRQSLLLLLAMIQNPFGFIYFGRSVQPVESSHDALFSTDPTSLVTFSFLSICKSCISCVSSCIPQVSLESLRCLDAATILYAFGQWQNSVRVSLINTFWKVLPIIWGYIKFSLFVLTGTRWTNDGKSLKVTFGYTHSELLTWLFGLNNTWVHDDVVAMVQHLMYGLELIIVVVYMTYLYRAFRTALLESSQFKAYFNASIDEYPNLATSPTTRPLLPPAPAPLPPGPLPFFMYLRSRLTKWVKENIPFGRIFLLQTRAISGRILLMVFPEFLGRLVVYCIPRVRLDSNEPSQTASAIFTIAPENYFGYTFMSVTLSTHVGPLLVAVYYAIGLAACYIYMAVNLRRLRHKASGSEELNSNDRNRVSFFIILSAMLRTFAVYTLRELLPAYICGSVLCQTLFPHYAFSPHPLHSMYKATVKPYELDPYTPAINHVFRSSEKASMADFSTIHCLSPILQYLFHVTSLGMAYLWLCRNVFSPAIVLSPNFKAARSFHVSMRRHLFKSIIRLVLLAGPLSIMLVVFKVVDRLMGWLLGVGPSAASQTLTMDNFSRSPACEILLVVLVGATWTTMALTGDPHMGSTMADRVYAFLCSASSTETDSFHRIARDRSSTERMSRSRSHSNLQKRSNPPSATRLKAYFSILLLIAIGCTQIALTAWITGSYSALYVLSLVILPYMLACSSKGWIMEVMLTGLVYSLHLGSLGSWLFSRTRCIAPVVSALSNVSHFEMFLVEMIIGVIVTNLFAQKYHVTSIFHDMVDKEHNTPDSLYVLPVISIILPKVLSLITGTSITACYRLSFFVLATWWYIMTGWRYTTHKVYSKLSETVRNDQYLENMQLENYDSRD